MFKICLFYVDFFKEFYVDLLCPISVCHIIFTKYQNHSKFYLLKTKITFYFILKSNFVIFLKLESLFNSIKIKMIVSY